MQSYTDHRDVTLPQLPSEVFRQVTQSLRPAELARVAGACGALHAAVMPELRGEREARDRLVQLSPGQLGAYGYDDAVAACRRWGLPLERPFAALARRAAVRLIATVTVSVPTPNWWWVHAHDSAGQNRLFKEREAPVRAHMVPARRALPVLLPGETLCVRGVRDVAEIPVSVDLGSVPLDHVECGSWQVDKCAYLSIRMEQDLVGRQERNRTHVTTYVYVEVPCDAAVYAEMVSSGAHHEARLRYAARVCELWGAPHGSLRPRPNSHHSWDMSTAAWEAARRYYERSGVPVSNLRVSVYVVPS